MIYLIFSYLSFWNSGAPFAMSLPNSTLLRVKELAGLDKISTCELETPPPSPQFFFSQLLLLNSDGMID
jgi:hypothetical protein